MRPNATLLSAGLTWATLMGSIMAQEPAKPSQAPSSSSATDEIAAHKDAAKAVIDSYFSNWKSGKGANNLSLFHSPQVVVTGTVHSPKEDYWTKSASEYMKRFPDHAVEYLPVDSIAVDLEHEGLAVVRAKYRGGGHKDSAVFTLALQRDRSWKIVSLFVDSHFVW